MTLQRLDRLTMDANATHWHTRRNGEKSYQFGSLLTSTIDSEGNELGTLSMFYVGCR